MATETAARNTSATGTAITQTKSTLWPYTILVGGENRKDLDQTCQFVEHNLESEDRDRKQEKL